MITEKLLQRGGTNVRVKTFDYGNGHLDRQIYIEGVREAAYRYERRPNGQREIFAFTNNGSSKLEHLQEERTGSETRVYVPRPEGPGLYLAERREVAWSGDHAYDTTTTTFFGPDGKMKTRQITLQDGRKWTGIYDKQGALVETRVSDPKRYGGQYDRVTVFEPDGTVILAQDEPNR